MIKNNYRINPSVRIYPDLLNKNFLVINHENKEQFIIENIETLDNFMRIIDSKKDITEDMQKLEAKCKKLRFIIKNNDPQIEIYNKYVTKYGWDDFFLDSLSDCQNVKIIKSQSKLKFSSDIYQYYDKILRRRTIRRFSSEKISNEIVVNILKIGIENYLDTGGLHKVLNGLTFYLVINYSPDLVSGIYKYEIKTKDLSLLKAGFFEKKLEKMISGQIYMQGASFCIIITAKIEPIVGDENIKYKDMIIEIGKIGHCFLEQSTNNNLGVFQTPAIVDSEASELLGTKVYEEDSFYILAIGKEMKKYG